MKLISMNSRNRRALVLGTLILVPSVGVPFVVKPYLHALSSIREQVSEEHDRLAKEQRAIALLPTLPAARERVAQQLTKELNRLFQSSDELVATGDLAQYVAGAAQDNGVRLQQSETRPSQPVVSGVQALQLEIHAEGDLDGILHFLRQLEYGGKLIRLGALSIDGGRGPWDVTNNTIASPLRSSAIPGMGASDSNRAQGVEVLSFSASVYGYRLIDPRWSSVNTKGKTAPSPFPSTPYAFESVDAILDHDPFSARRARPPVSYRVVMGKNDQSPEQLLMQQRRQWLQRQQQQTQQQLHLLGTVLDPARSSFVMCQSGNASPRILRVGQQIDGYTLASIERGAAVFTTPDNGQLRLRTNASETPEAGAGVGWAGRRRRNRNGQGGQADTSQSGVSNGDQFPPTVQNAIQQLFPNGLPAGTTSVTVDTNFQVSQPVPTR